MGFREREGSEGEEEWVCIEDWLHAKGVWGDFNVLGICTILLYLWQNISIIIHVYHIIYCQIFCVIFLFCGKTSGQQQEILASWEGLGHL